MAHKQEFKTTEINLKSTVENVGDTVTQIFHFVGGVKRTYDGIIVDSIRQGQFTKFKCKNGAMVMVNDSNVLMIEIFEENTYPKLKDVFKKEDDTNILQ